MAFSKELQPDSQGLLELRLRLFGRIGLYTGSAAALVMFAILLYLLPGRTEGYRATLVAFQLSADNLPWVLTLAGAGLAAASGLISWLISLYGSFRIAGPVYRFSRNLERADRDGPAPMLPLRQDDCLREEAESMQAAAEAVARHYQGLDEALAAAIDQLEAQTGEVSPAPESYLSEISRIAQRVTH